MVSGCSSNCPVLQEERKSQKFSYAFVPPTLLIQSVVSLLSSSTMDSHTTSSGHCAWEGTEVTAVWQTLRQRHFPSG